MNILVTGWFSFENMGNTAGDIIVRDIICNWIKEAGINYKVAVAASYPYPGGVNWETEDPECYSDLLFVCGPFGNGWPLTDLLKRFNKLRIIGINITLNEPLERWNPFYFLNERDSANTSHPDITFYAPPSKIPVVGLVLMQGNYGNKDRHVKVHKTINQFIRKRELSIVQIDTSMKDNQGGLKSQGEIEALIAKMDLVISTRLHGIVLALKNGIPVIPVDPLEGGGKITRQVKCIGWPVLVKAEEINEVILQDALSYCFTEEAREKVVDCTINAIHEIEKTHLKFVNKLKEIAEMEVENLIKSVSFH